MFVLCFSFSTFPSPVPQSFAFKIPWWLNIALVVKTSAHTNCDASQKIFCTEATNRSSWVDCVKQKYLCPEKFSDWKMFSYFYCGSWCESWLFEAILYCFSSPPPHSSQSTQSWKDLSPRIWYSRLLSYSTKPALSGACGNMNQGWQGIWRL